jgi:hypothetical protein
VLEYHRDIHLLLDVVEGIGGVDGEADQDDMRVGVRERTETIVVLLSSRIPKSELNMLSIDLNIGNIVLEDGGHIDLEISDISSSRPWKIRF